VVFISERACTCLFLLPSVKAYLPEFWLKERLVRGSVSEKVDIFLYLSKTVSSSCWFRMLREWSWWMILLNKQVEL